MSNRKSNSGINMLVKQKQNLYSQLKKAKGKNRGIIQLKIEQKKEEIEKTQKKLFLLK